MKKLIALLAIVSFFIFPPVIIIYILLAIVLYFLDTQESIVSKPPYLHEKSSLIKIFYILLLPLKIISRIKYYKRKTNKHIVVNVPEEETERIKAVGKVLEELLNGIKIDKPIDDQKDQALDWIRKEKLPLSNRESDNFIDKIFNKYSEREKMIKNSLQKFILQADSEKSLEDQLFEWIKKENLNLSDKEMETLINIEELRTSINRNKIFKNR